jgi:hypothetical protein
MDKIVLALLAGMVVLTLYRKLSGMLRRARTQYQQGKDV